MTDAELSSEHQTIVSEIRHSTGVNIISGVMKIVITALVVVVICLGITTVLVVLNERSTQINADRQERINEELRTELECLRIPAFESDAAEAQLSIITARGLAAVSLGDREVLDALSADLQAGANKLEEKLAARGESLNTCTPDSNN